MGKLKVELSQAVPLNKIIDAQDACPYFERKEFVEGLDDDHKCLHDMERCERHKRCPLDRW
ncbi:MAG: hypothetical protein WC374_11515 [Phycisphaerae bacterium]|jgi:hypothetical protein